MTVKFITLGCKVNQFESQAMLEALLADGFAPALPGQAADVVVLNSCTVTAQSDQKARKALRRARRENPGAILVLCGCLPQAFPERAAQFPEADLVLGNARRADLAPRLREFLENRQPIVAIPPHQKGEAFEPLPLPLDQGRTRAFLKIQDGCDRFCAYCAIPYARGRARSMPLEDVAAAVGSLGEAGYREVVLTGINLPAWGKEWGLSLCDAVEAACAAGEVSRVRLGSLEPELLEPAVIQRLARQEKLCPQFHLSLQSGCDETLRRMNRRYTTGDYRRIVSDLRGAFPNCAITTDIMVGFPGETQQEFEASLAFAREIGFAKAHVFAYSRRPGTRADGFANQVPPAVKEARSQAMIAATKETQRAFLAAQLGQEQEVLFEQEKAPGLWEGHTRNYTHVLCQSQEDLSNRLAVVELKQVEGESVRGALG